MTRVALLGPAGTFSDEALATTPPAAPSGVGRAGGDLERVYVRSFHDALGAVADGRADRAFVPIENSLEGPVNATLDALVASSDVLRIAGEVVHPVRHCLVAREPLDLDEIEAVLSHPQASGQCAGFLRAELPAARVLAASSTADAVRSVAADDAAHAAIGTRWAAIAYGCVVLRAGVEDEEGNETRFVWIVRAPASPASPGARGAAGPPGPGAPAKTSVAFWGAGTEAPGWLVRCLSEFSQRGVNLTKIESRPLREGLGSYRFFVDLEGSDEDPVVAEALAGLRLHCEQVRTLGSYPAAAGARDPS